VNLMKHYIRDIRNYCRKKLENPNIEFKASINNLTGITDPGNPDCGKSGNLVVTQPPEPYSTFFQDFKKYFITETEIIQDQSMLEEIKIIESILGSDNDTKDLVDLSFSRNPFDWETRYTKIESSINELKNKYRSLTSETKPNSMDICFLMDCTGSMGSWIKSCRDQVISIIDIIVKHFPNIVINLSFIGYHDIQDTPRFDISAFTTNVPYIKDFIEKNCNANGGGDLPEDVCGGLNEALKLNWISEKKLIILIADAPCHGNMFHNCDPDNYPNGDPSGLEPEVLLAELALKGINLFISEITDQTEIMLNAWRKSYERYNFSDKEIRSFNLTDNTHFLPLISDAIATVLSD